MDPPVVGTHSVFSGDYQGRAIEAEERKGRRARDGRVGTQEGERPRLPQRTCMSNFSQGVRMVRSYHSGGWREAI
ncbi:MAG TPA: hypothetical protein VEZ14_04525 [Dehalococcoidia bacterium]|nr:hypothetical protein [Dehalococcoidia bacterium]